MTEAADRGNAQANREADYMCSSPLRRKTSELEGEEGEEEYTSRLVSRNLGDWRRNLIDKGCAIKFGCRFREKTVKKLFIFFTVLKNNEKK
jgi:hypothetical protein